VDGSIRHNCQFEGDTFWDVQPVKAEKRCSNVAYSETRLLKKLVTHQLTCDLREGLSLQPAGDGRFVAGGAVRCGVPRDEFRIAYISLSYIKLVLQFFWFQTTQ